MKRYNFISSNLHGRTAEVYGDEEGRWVKYSDANAAIEQARREEGEAIIDLAATMNPSKEITRLVQAIRERGEEK